MENQNGFFSAIIRAGKTTYFVDVKETKNGNKYLSISENQYNGDVPKRTTMRIFGNAIDRFKKAVNDATLALSEL